jgi:outer membrane protein OmpA-like peptidoglycan-associated protein
VESCVILDFPRGLSASKMLISFQLKSNLGSNTMAAFNEDSGEINGSEGSVSEPISAVPKAVDQLQELVVILTELQLLKNSQKTSRQLNLPPSEKSAERLEENRDRENSWSFVIEPPAVVQPEIMKDSEEIAGAKNINEDSDLSRTAAKLVRDERQSEEELEQAVPQFKQLQQLLFGRDLPELYSNVLSVQQRLENCERLMSEPTELMNLLKPLIPELLKEQVEELQSEFQRAIEARDSRIDTRSIQAKLADLENKIADYNTSARLSDNRPQVDNSEELIERLMPIMGELLNRKVEESKLEIASAIAPTVNQVIHHLNGVDEKVLIIDNKFADLQQKFLAQPQDLVKQLVPIVGELLERKISELKLEVIEALTPSVQVRIAWVEIEEKVLSIIASRLASQQSQIQQPAEIMALLMPGIVELLNRKIDESKLELKALIAPLEAAINQQEVAVTLANVETKVNNLQRKQNSQPEEIMARLMPLMIESLNRKIYETKLEVKEAIALAVSAAIDQSGIAAQVLRNENHIVEVQQQVFAEIEGLMARIMPRIVEMLSRKISDAKLEIEAAIAPAVDAIIQNKRIEERLGKIEQKIVAIEHRIYESTDLFTDLLKPLIDELMVSHHAQLEQSVIESILPLLDEVVNYNYKLNDQVTSLEDKITNTEWWGSRPDLVVKIKEIFPEMMLRTINESKVAFTETIAPIIDEVINAKTRQNRQSMGIAIAPAIPVGISHRITEAPDEFAKAIAPEIAAAVKHQINLDREAMSDAIYPIIGSTILKYMAETMQEINKKLEQAVSVEGITRKLKAKLLLISEAELLMKETTPQTVKAVFLIQKESGLVISGVQQSEQEQLESDMVAGMLTAIRSFVNDCIAQSGNIAEIDAIEYGTSTIILEVAGSCYLAAVMQGEIRQWFKYKMREILKKIVQEYGNEIKSFNGDPATVPVEVTSQIQKLIHADVEVKSTNKPPLLLIVGLAALGLIGVPWGINQYRSGVEGKLEADIGLALQSAPELSVYRLTADVRDQVVRLSGRVPNQKLRSRAEKIAQQAVPTFRLDNQIIAVEVPPDPVLAEADVKRTVALLNQVESIDISARYVGGKVAVKGSVVRSTDAQKITEAFEKIPGVKSVTNTVRVVIELPSKVMEISIYFDAGAAILNPKEVTQKLNKVKELMQENSANNFLVIGYSDFKSNPGENQKLALSRARNVKAALVKQGIDGNRIQIAATKGRPKGVEENQSLSLSRAVTFEVVK